MKNLRILIGAARQKLKAAERLVGTPPSMGVAIKLGETADIATLPKGPATFVLRDHTSGTSEVDTGYLSPNAPKEKA